MCRLPHAEDRNSGGAQQLREFTHLQIHLADDDGQVQDSQPLHVVPYRQVYGLGNKGTDDLEDDFTVAGWTITSVSISRKFPAVDHWQLIRLMLAELRSLGSFFRRTWDLSPGWNCFYQCPLPGAGTEIGKFVFHPDRAEAT